MENEPIKSPISANRGFDAGNFDHDYKAGGSLSYSLKPRHQGITAEPIAPKKQESSDLNQEDNFFKPSPEKNFKNRKSLLDYNNILSYYKSIYFKLVLFAFFSFFLNKLLSQDSLHAIFIIFLWFFLLVQNYRFYQNKKKFFSEKKRLLHKIIFMFSCFPATFLLFVTFALLFPAIILFSLLEEFFH